MPNPPKQKQVQDAYVQTAVRLPHGLRDEIRESAETNGRSMNAEIIARLQSVPASDRIDKLAKEQREIKKMLLEILDAVGRK